MRDEDRRFAGGPAFPVVECDPVHGTRVECGMTLRDWFAGMALQGMNANPGFDNMSWPDTAKVAYIAADAMLEARVK